MKQFTIRIPDNKVGFFVELMRSISFVNSIKEDKIADIQEERKSMVREGIQKYKNQPESYLDLDEIEKRLKEHK